MHPLQSTALEVGNESITLHELIQRARALNQTQFVESAITAALIRQAANDMELFVSKEEIQAAADVFRATYRLQKAEDALSWLKSRGLTVGEWQATIEEEVLRAKFRHRKFGRKVETYFAEHKLEFDCATISRIVVDSEGLACELVLQLKEEGASFEDLARLHSLDKENRAHGGYIGKVNRKGLGPAASAAIFGSKPGTTHGPFKVGKEHRILRLINLHPAVLDDATREEIENILLNEWIAEARERTKISIPLYEAIPAVAEVAG